MDLHCSVTCNSPRLEINHVSIIINLITSHNEISKFYKKYRCFIGYIDEQMIHRYIDRQIDRQADISPCVYTEGSWKKKN